MMTEFEYWMTVILRFLYKHIYKVWIALMILVIVCIRNCGE